MALAVQSGSCCSPANNGGLSFSVKSSSDSSSLAFPNPIDRRRPLPGFHTKVSSFLGRSTSFVNSKQRYGVFHGQRSRRGRHVTRAESGGYNNNAVISPCEFESPIGQFLVSLLQSHPHLFSEAADQQIQQLAADREASEKKSLQTTGADLVLYKRIAEVKDHERHKSIVEVIYSLIVQKFLAAGMTLVPKLAELPHNKQVDNWPYREDDMIRIHSPEVLEVVKDHLGMILGRPNAYVHEQHTLVQASKMRIGHLYAATIIFGYFLRRLDQRYQLDMSMKKALGSSPEEQPETPKGVSPELDFKTDVDGEKLAAEANIKIAEMAALKSAQAGYGLGIFPQLGWKPGKLKSYVLSMDHESVQRFAKLRSKASLDVVEKQTQALFGNPQAEIAPDGSLVFMSGDTFTISLAGLRRLVLEAVAFGSFLWDVESYVDSYYSLL